MPFSRSFPKHFKQRGQAMQRTQRILFILPVFLFCHFVHAQYSNETELTSVVNGGNSVQNTFNFKSINAYAMDKNTVKLGGHYTYGKADGELNTRNWDVNTRYERAFTDQKSVFAIVQREENIFANLEYRWNYDFGASVKFLKTKEQELKGEAGYRRTLESSPSGEKVSGTKARIYAEYSRQHNESLYFRLWVEAVPNFSIQDDWQLSFEPSANVTLTNIFSLKLAYLHRYDNLPLLDSKKSDYTYTTSILARF